MSSFWSLDPGAISSFRDWIQSWYDSTASCGLGTRGRNAGSLHLGDIVVVIDLVAVLVRILLVGESLVEVMLGDSSPDSSLPLPEMSAATWKSTLPKLASALSIGHAGKEAILLALDLALW
ncbi:hypothetical protein PG985_008540 [Apiospora marii]|uniref:uncharacterized protein n=1 Tax=Apiospora marii TaxID=335849 RepID=UPI0031316255